MVIFSISCYVLTAFVIVSVEGKRSERNVQRLSDIINTLLDLDRLPRQTGSRGTTVKVTPREAVVGSSTGVFNYWLSQRTSGVAERDLRGSQASGSVDRVATSLANQTQSKLEKLREEIRYQSLVKKTNQEFLSYLNKVIADKKAELEKEDEEIKAEYEELNRTRKALFDAYGRQSTDLERMEGLRTEVAEKEGLYEQLLRRRVSPRFSRGVRFGSPWVNIHYPGNSIVASLRSAEHTLPIQETSDDDEDEQETTTLHIKDLLWNSLRKFLPFQKEAYSPDGSLPLEIHYRVGKDIAHITIRVPHASKSVTPPYLEPNSHRRRGFTNI